MPPSPFSSRNESLSHVQAEAVQRAREAERAETKKASGRNGKPFEQMSVEELEAVIGRKLPSAAEEPKSAPRRKRPSEPSPRPPETDPLASVANVEARLTRERDVAARYHPDEAKELDEELTIIRQLIEAIHQHPADATLLDRVRDMERRYHQ